MQDALEIEHTNLGVLWMTAAVDVHFSVKSDIVSPGLL